MERELKIAATGETFLMRMKPYRTTDNRIDGYVLSFLDITGRKRNEDALERQRQDLAQQYAELENLYDTTPVGLALIDRDLRYLRINEMLARIDGHDIADYEGRTIPDVMPEIADAVVPLYRGVFQSGQAVLGQEIEARMEETGDLLRHFIADFYPVRVEDEVYAVGVCVREVTDQKKLMNDLAESEALMKRVFDQTPFLIGIVEGPDHRIAYANPKAQALTGDRPLVGMTLLEAMPELEGQGQKERYDHVFRTGEAACHG